MKFLKFPARCFAPAPFQPYEFFQEAGLRRLTQNFYHIMESDPAAKDCLAVHHLENGRVPEEVKEKLFAFLSGWMGGPQLFVQKHGPPRMRARHMGFKIGEREREQWIYCMAKALDMEPAKLSRKRKQVMLNSFQALAFRIQNSPG